MVDVFTGPNKLFKKFFSLKIRIKFLLSFIFVICLITGITGGVTYITTMLLLENHTKDLSAQLVNQIAVNIEYKAKDLNDFTYGIIQNESLKSILTGKSEKINNKNITRLRKRIHEIINGLVLSNDHIDYICIQTSDGIYFWWDKSEMNQSGGMNEDLAKNIINSVANKVESSNNGIVWTASQQDNNVVYARKMIDEKKVSNNLGIIAFGVNSSYLRTLESSSSVVKEENIMILNQYDEVLVSSEIINVNGFEAFKSRRDIMDSSEASTSIEFGNASYILAKYETNFLKWKIFSFIPVDILMKNATLLKTIIALVSIGSIGIAFIIAIILSSSMTKNIRSLEKTMRFVEDGDLNVRVKPSSYDEIGLLGLRFNYMVNRIRELINTVSRERLLKQQAEFEVLQAQINPHFLYNTLGTIKWFAHMKDQDEIEKMITALINLLKTTVKKKGRYQTVAEEIEYIKNYILLQKFRFEDRFRVEYSIDEACAGLYILNFILQPLVENALYHGIRMTDNNGIIWIRAYQCGQVLKLEVEDNGVGMPEDAMARILAENKKASPGLNSIGVSNVHQRIRLFFGEEYGLKYTSAEGRGTLVEILLPCVHKKIEENEHDENNGG